jgi:ATP-dependent protease ClpP protease subunit
LPETWFEFNTASTEVATVRIYNEIGGFGIAAADFINELDAITAPLIRVHLNSPGGSVDEGLAIMNALIDHPSEVETHVDAAAYSIASVIAQAGKRRIMAPHSRMMVHEAMALGMGYASDLEKVALHLRETTDMIAGIYAEKSGRSVEYWRQKMADETRFTDKQAVTEGLADSIGRVTNLQDFKIAANFDWSKVRNGGDLKAEFEAVAEASGPEMAEIIAQAVEEGIKRGTSDVLGAVQAVIDSKVAPSDAARRDMEAALARVQL